MANQGKISECVALLLISEMVHTVDSTVAKHSHGDETDVLAAHLKLEAIGFDVGFRFIERVAEARLMPTEPLEAIKFLCKDLWQEVYGKPIDKLQTNHKGVFVLKDAAFKWTSRHSSKNEAALKQSQIKALKFPSGLLRGALSNLGYTAIVTADIENVDGKQMTSFQVRLST